MGVNRYIRDVEKINSAMKLPRDEKGKLLPRGGFSKQVSFRVDGDLYEELSNRAQKQGLTVAEYMRYLTTDLVKKNES